MKNTKFKRLTGGANTIEQVLVAFDAVLPRNASDFGVIKERGTSIQAARKAANAKALDVLSRVKDSSLLTEEDKIALKAYTGEGGIGGSTSEYYTPTFLAKGVFNILEAYGVKNGNLCEPSCGTGVFNDVKPPSFIITGAEVSDTSSAINQLLHPEDKIHNTPFEELAKQTPDGYFDGFVGNVPFGDSRSEYANIDPEYKSTKTIEEYFILRAIDKVKAGGLITLVVPTQIVDSAKLTKFRRKVSKKAEFLGAHRIPSGTFEASGSAEVVTDVIVLRKHSDDLSLLISNAKPSTLTDANVMWPEFILGKWFKGEGKRFIHGEVFEGAGNWGSDVVKIPNLPKVEDGNSRLTDEQLAKKQEIVTLHNQSIGKKLSQKFDSRIDWELLNVAEPVVVNYVDGDRRLINGRWHEMAEGDWVLVPLTDKNGLFDASLYGAASIDSIERSVSSAQEALSLSYEQLSTIHDTLQDKCSGQIISIVKMANEAPAEHRERIVRGALIGSLIQDYLHAVDQDRARDSDLHIIQKLLTQMYSEMGSSINVKGIDKLRGQDAALYRLFAGAMDKKGKFSDLISGKLKREKIIVHDTSNPLHVVEKLSLEGHKGNVSLEEFREIYTGDPVLVNDNELLAHLSQYENIAITPEGELSPLDRATSGKIASKRNGLMRALADDSYSPAVKRNFERQLEEIQKRRKWSSAKRINFGLRARWIPRQLVKDFLHENGFDKFKYVSVSKNELEEIVEDDTYTQADGIFTGYYTRNGKKVTAGDKDKQFLAQLEKYLNGFDVQSKDNQTSSKYRDRIRRLEKSFQRWMRQHSDIDEITTLYNDTFNGDIAFEHLDGDLGLENVSGEIEHFPYQNTGIRRLSEDGSGILGFGTGLGKTFTALGLVAYDQQNKRSRRSCIVVPKSVMENWIYETVMYFGYHNLDKTLFVGFDIEYDKDGQPKTIPIMDGDTGEQKVNKKTGTKLTRPVLRERSAEEIIQRMHAIPHSDINLVIMTKEQFAKIPLKYETLKQNAGEHMDAHQSSGLVDMYADSYRAKAKKEKLQERLLSDGSEKAEDFPYMEDLNFDKVIADEGHNYRNSQEAGRQSRKLMYMAAGTEAKIAADMRQKMQYLQRKNNGRGAVLLTATPTPNSPIDAYNMLSHVMKPSDWHKIGIVNQDDFIQEFGEVEEVMVNRLNGETVMAQGLTGFKNLDGLRSLFHRWINKKDHTDVGANVKVPDVEEVPHAVEMSKEQKTAYELLRFRAELISVKTRGEDPYANRSNKEIDLIDRLSSMYPDDQLFSVIRDMDRVTTDIELFNKRMTFIFAKENAAKSKALIESLPTEKTIKVKDLNEHGERVEVKVSAFLNAVVKDDADGRYVVVINDAFESELLKGLKQAKLSQKDINHPLSPKYAQMIELMKESLESNGKMLVFSEEKTQHKKLHRLICHHLNLEPDQVGILNGDTVSGIESASNDENHKKLSAKQLKEVQLSGDDFEEEGLEAIAAKYNEGKYRVLILNKKGEVGVNLHIGTSDIFHATLPWNPASIDQRNGRGARVGAPQEVVNSHFLVAKGSFDLFRKDTIDRKRKWQKELFDGDDVRVANGDAESELDTGMLLSANPEEYKAKQKEAQRQLELKMQQEAKEDAQINLHRYIDASVLSSISVEDEERIEQKLSSVYNYSKDIEDQNVAKAQAARKAWMDSKENAASSADDIADNKSAFNYWAKAVAKSQEQTSRDKIALNKQRKRIESVSKAKNTLKALAPEIEEAMDSGLLASDPRMLSHPSEFAVLNGRTFKLGGYYQLESGVFNVETIVKITSIDNTKGICTVDTILGRKANYENPLKSLGKQVSYNEDDIALRVTLSETTFIKLPTIVSQDDFVHYIKEKAINPSVSVYLYAGEDYERIELRKVTPEQYVDLVYPDPNNKSLRKKLAKLYIRLKASYKDTSYLDLLAEAVFGDNYYLEMAQYNENPTSAEGVAKWLAERFDRIEKVYQKASSTAIDYEDKRNYTERMQRSMWRLITDAPNVIDKILYESAIKDHYSALEQRFESDYASYFKAMGDANSKLITNALNDSESLIKDRLRSIGAGILRRNYNGREEFESILAPTGYKSIVILLADLISAGYVSGRIEGTNYELTDSQLTSIFSSTWSNMKYNTDLLHAFIVEDKAKAVSDAVSTTPVEVSADSLGTILYAQALADIGIQVKRNSTAVEFKSRRGKTYRSEDEYAIVGFFDPKGKSGQLFANKESFKSLCDAKYIVDLSHEFSGSWWVIKSDLSPELVLKAFGLN